MTWNPSVVSVCKDSLYCPTTEEYILPVIHGNDRVEWFVQLSDEIRWDVEDRDTGAVRAKVIMRVRRRGRHAGDIRHQGYSPKRSMLLVWENASPELPELIASGSRPARCPSSSEGRRRWRTILACRRRWRASCTTATPSPSRASPTSSRTPPATRSSARAGAT